MIIVSIPNNNIEERKYIIDVLLNEFLGLKYKTEISDSKDYEIELPNKATLIIKDYFFSNFRENKSYLNKENIPFEISLSKNEFTSESNIPVIYGIDDLKINRDKIICSIDIFASAFYMLTRWEEYVIKERDSYNRFSAIDSLACKNNFLNRPIVNEYVEFLWNMLIHLGYKENRKKHIFKVFITHDIDFIHYKPKIREFLGDLLKRRSISSFLNRLYYSIVKNPFDTFDYLMAKSESIDEKSIFYFMTGNTCDLDYENYTNHAYFKTILEKILRKGHKIGLHSSFNSIKNDSLYINEKNKLEQISGVKINENRQHYLRFDIPDTWQLLAQDFNIDSSLGYPEKEGFRCGTCWEFSVFDLLNCKKMQLVERPLIVMENSLVTYQKLNVNEVVDRTKEKIDIVKKYNGNFVFLWHNTSFNLSNWKKYQIAYNQIIEYIGKTLES